MNEEIEYTYKMSGRGTKNREDAIAWARENDVLVHGGTITSKTRQTIRFTPDNAIVATFEFRKGQDLLVSQFVLRFV